MADSSSQHVFIPRRRLSGAHAQTIAGNFLRRTNALPTGEQRIIRVGATAEGEAIHVLCSCHWQERRATRLTTIIVHGLEGSVESQYVIGTGSKAWVAGMNVVRMNMRNCGDSEKLTPTLYHSGLSGDIAAVIGALVAQEHLERVAVVGYSMGGNLAMKMAAELGTEVPPQLKALATVSPAMDLGISADALHHWKNRIYEMRFLRNLNARFRRKAKLFPGRYDVRHLRGLKSIRDFDEEITARYEGFTGADDYYTRSSSGPLADKIRVPTLVIHALDDPFVRMSNGTRARLIANPNVQLIETQHGGHCAFLEEPNGYDGRWAEKTVVDFLKQF